MTDIVQLDARGLQCPLPLLKLKQQLNRMQVGQQIQILTTDVGSVRDFNAFVAQAGHRLLHSTEEAGEYRFLIQKGDS
ncbi:MAG TPA: sulfurtransferase TusA family protein [Dongiaceae bacterium]|nr:sulfurtransferase TusA family protein [Dongiaceae bacterium]